MSKSLFERTSLKFGCNALYRKSLAGAKLQMLTWIYSLKKVRKVQFFIFLKKSGTNNNYLKSNDPKEESKHVKYLDANNYMVMLCLNFFPQVHLNEKER